MDTALSASICRSLRCACSSSQATRLEKQAYAALDKVEERAVKFHQSHTQRRLEQHLAAWEHLSADAEDKIARYDTFHQIAQQVDALFALIDLASGQLRDAVAGAECLHSVGSSRDSSLVPDLANRGR